MPTGQIQQFCWAEGNTRRDFIRLLNEAGAAGYQLYSTYKVVDRFMGALLFRWQEPAGVVKEAMPPAPAQVLRLVLPEPDEDEQLHEADPDDGSEQ